MISEDTIKKLFLLLNKNQKEDLKSSITKTFGETISEEIDKDPITRQKMNNHIYRFISDLYRDEADKILFDANESMEQIGHTTRTNSTEDQIDTIKDFSSGSGKTTNQAYDYNKILDGRTSTNIFIDNALSNVDEETRAIIIKSMLCLSCFIAIICFLSMLLNTTNINQVQNFYNIGYPNFLFQYAQLCDVDVALAKNNKCVIDHINEKIQELTKSRFWNTFGLVLFTSLSAFFCYHLSTYRQGKK